jgi:hypothetical protein
MTVRGPEPNPLYRELEPGIGYSGELRLTGPEREPSVLDTPLQDRRKLGRNTNGACFSARRRTRPARRYEDPRTAELPTEARRCLFVAKWQGRLP